MEVRQTKKKVEIGGRKFVLNKFDPLFGTYISFQIFEAAGSKEVGIESMIKIFLSNGYNHFENYSKQILKYCSEILASGEVPVVNEENNIAISDLNPGIIIELITRELVFNLDDFFVNDPEVTAQGNSPEGL